MKIAKLASWVLTGAVFLLGASLMGFATAGAAEKLDNATCLTCHDGKKEKLEVSAANGEKRALNAVKPDKYGKSVHGEMQCVACHKDIVDNEAPHKKSDAPKANCVTCHETLWEAVKKDNLTKEKERMGLVVENIEAYKKSFHSRPNKEDKSHVNATCDQCHDTHSFNVPPRGTAKRTEWHLGVPNVCGEKCHSDELEEYGGSVHGKEVIGEHNPKAAVCTDCHTSHDIANTSTEGFKTSITKGCGSCHTEELKSYRETYHGQVNMLGYGYTAKCYDCHGSHGITKVDDSDSKVNPKNRLKTCKQCHNGKKDLKEATPGFATFGPHANAHDFKKYPEVWVAKNFMIALLIGVFAFFWAHTILWFYREWKDRTVGKHHLRVRVEDIPQGKADKQIRRFGPIWRLAHLLFALCTMTLVLTGTSALYADSNWAPVVVGILGGAKAANIIHRVAATIFLTIFFSHFVYMVYSLMISERRKTFKWFGPDSLVPNWQDLADIIGMFKWFVGLGEKPKFDRWTYWEKFDYWAVFWGVAIIGGSGAMLVFPSVTATFLPGWVFNVLTLVHGEEAFLAAVFLFTVHFFNNHFRPDKLPPPDVVMFTGSVALEEFMSEHPAQYKRLVETGQLDKYLVDAPSAPMTLGSKLLGLTLLAIGLTLLVLVGNGFFGGM